MASEEFIKITFTAFEAVIQYPVLLKDYCSNANVLAAFEKIFSGLLGNSVYKEISLHILGHTCSSHEITVEKSCPGQDEPKKPLPTLLTCFGVFLLLIIFFPSGPPLTHSVPSLFLA